MTGIGDQPTKPPPPPPEKPPPPPPPPPKDVFGGTTKVAEATLTAAADMMKTGDAAAAPPAPAAPGAAAPALNDVQSRPVAIDQKGTQYYKVDDKYVAIAKDMAISTLKELPQGVAPPKPIETPADAVDAKPAAAAAAGGVKVDSVNNVETTPHAAMAGFELKNTSALMDQTGAGGSAGRDPNADAPQGGHNAGTAPTDATPRAAGPGTPAGYETVLRLTGHPEEPGKNASRTAATTDAAAGDQTGAGGAANRDPNADAPQGGHNAGAAPTDATPRAAALEKQPNPGDTLPAVADKQAAARADVQHGNVESKPSERLTFETAVAVLTQALLVAVEVAGLSRTDWTEGAIAGLATHLVAGQIPAGAGSAIAVGSDTSVFTSKSAEFQKGWATGAAIAGVYTIAQGAGEAGGGTTGGIASAVPTGGIGAVIGFTVALDGVSKIAVGAEGLIAAVAMMAKANDSDERVVRSDSTLGKDSEKNILGPLKNEAVHENQKAAAVAENLNTKAFASQGDEVVPIPETEAEWKAYNEWAAQGDAARPRLSEADLREKVAQPKAEIRNELVLRGKSADDAAARVAAAKPDHLVRAPGGEWKIWDTRLLQGGETVDFKTIVQAINDKIEKGQTLRVAFNMDLFKGKFTPTKEALESIENKYLASEGWSTAMPAGGKEVVFVQDNKVYRYTLK